MGQDIVFTIGMALIILNPVVGYGGIGAAAYFYKKTPKRLYLILGASVYAFSWLMLIAGAFMAGTQGIKLAKAFLKKNLFLSLAAAAVIGLLWLFYRLRKNSNEKNKN